MNQATRRHFTRRLCQFLPLMLAVAWPARVSAATTVTAWGSNAEGQTAVPPGLADAVQISAGRDHSLALRSDGTVVAWGRGSTSPTNVPAGLDQVVAISAGYSHSLALRQDGKVIAWIPGGSLLNDIPADLTNVIAIAAGAGHSLVLRSDRTVAAWGVNSRGQAAVPVGLTNVIAIAAGFEHSVALTGEGEIIAWGRNDYGQASLPAGIKDFIAIAAGYFHTLGLRRDGSVIGWGRNVEGQAASPPSAMKAVAIAAGGYQSMALRRDGQLFLWGSAADGLAVVPPGTTNIVRIAAGAFHRAVLQEDSPPVFQNGSTQRIAYAGSTVTLDGRAAGLASLVYQWRRSGMDIANATNAFLTLSEITTADEGEYAVTVTDPLGRFSTLTISVQVGESLPLVVSDPTEAFPVLGSRTSLRGVVQGSRPMTLQWLHDGIPLPLATNAALNFPVIADTDQGVYSLVASNAFGRTESRGVLLWPGTYAAWGNIATTGQFNPADGTNHFAAVAASQSYALWLTTDGNVLARGSGSGVQNLTNVPPSVTNIVALAAGVDFCLALDSQRRVTHWGRDIGGVPPDLTNVIALAAGSRHALALRDNGTVRAFGQSPFSSVLTVPTSLSNVVAISCGLNLNVALTLEGRVVAWGANSSGQTNVPPGLSDVVAISAGSTHVLALKNNGDVVAWGSNASGESTVPDGLSDVMAIEAGGSQSLALRRDGTVVAWGANSQGQSSVPSFLRNVSALAAGQDFNIALIGNRVDPDEIVANDSTRAGGLFQVSVTTRRGKTYWLESSDSLGGAWKLVKGFAGNGGDMTLSDDIEAGARQRFYRIKLQ